MITMPKFGPVPGFELFNQFHGTLYLDKTDQMKILHGPVWSGFGPVTDVFALGI